MLFGEVVSDRMPRPYLLLMTQTTLMILAFGPAALTLLGHIQPRHIVEKNSEKRGYHIKRVWKKLF